VSRSQWAQIIAWSFLVGCCLLAGIITYMQVSRRLTNIRANLNTRREIARQEHALQLREQIRRADARRLLADNTPHEDALFLQQLQMLLSRSGTKAIRIDAVPLSPLPDISDVKPDGSRSTESSRPRDPETLSLTHLPLNVQARSVRIVLLGGFDDVRRFLHNVATYSSNTMWLNTNTLRLDRISGQRNLRATIVITRFIRSLPDSRSAQK
jgi:hypothetical protein